MRFIKSCLAVAVLSLLGQSAPLIAADEATDSPRYCQEDPTHPDLDVSAFKKQIALALRAFPTAYMTNVCVYRESKAFIGGSSGSLVATLDAENVRGLPTLPHPTPESIACAPTNDIPCVRVS